MGYLKKDGTPRRIPKTYTGVWAKYNTQVKPEARKSVLNGAVNAKKMRRNYRKSNKIRYRAAQRTKRLREEEVLMSAMTSGNLDEVHDLMLVAKSADLHPAQNIYDKNGNIIPTKLKTDYDPAVGDDLCDRIACGEVLTKICSGTEKPCTLAKVRKWYRDVPEFKRKLDMAYSDRTDYYVDKLYQLMQDVESGTLGPRQASFIADQIRWMAEKLNPKFIQKSSKMDLNVVNDGDGNVNFQIILAGENTVDGEAA
jgi:hypothetical protein